MDITFSVIIPIYNASKTISNCLHSIKNQDFYNYEVILIDDGSTDNTCEICRKICNEDKRFKFFSQENSGPSKARNNGLDKASGKYIIFIDSDDFIDANYLTIVYDCFERTNADIIFIGYYLTNMEKKIIEERVPTTLKENTFETIFELSNQDMYGYSWIKVFKKNVIGNKRFREDMNLFEDEIFINSIIQFSTQIQVIPKPLYYYVIGDQSALTKKLHKNYCWKRGQVFDSWAYMLRNYEKKDLFLEFIANKSIINCIYYGLERKIDVKEFFNELLSCSFFINYAENNKMNSYIKNKNYLKIKFCKFLYNFKNKILELIRKEGRL